MLIWMTYVLAVTVLLSAAAYFAERAARSSGATSRWIWVGTLLASLIIPAVIASVSVQVPSLDAPTAVQKIIPLRAVTSTYMSPTVWLTSVSGDTKPLQRIDPLLERAWLVLSATLALALLASGIHLYWRKRRWLQMTVAGTQVFIAENVGPAVVGLLRPRIVMPTWLMQSQTSNQAASIMAAAILHEQSHLKAGDQQLFTVGLCLLVFMPWNLPLWWQLKRLRYAIEVDCDARVLSGGHNASEYGAALIEVGQRQSAFIGAVAAMSESKSFLEERIEIMMSKPGKWRRVSAVALSLLAISFVAAAAQVSPPNADVNNGRASSSTDSSSTGIATAPATKEHHEIMLDPKAFDRYVGSYQLAPTYVLQVTRDGNKFLAQLTGQPSVEIFPEGNGEFFYKLVNAQISFVTDADGQVTSLVLHQNGNNMPAKRVDDTVAHDIATALQARIQNQTPVPGSDAALRRLIDGLIHGKPNYSEMSPQMMKATQQQLSHLQPMVASLGAVQSIEFKSVGSQGWDAYEVRQEHGSFMWRIAFDNNVITGALVGNGP